MTLPSTPEWEGSVRPVSEQAEENTIRMYVILLWGVADTIAEYPDGQRLRALENLAAKIHLSAAQVYSTLQGLAKFGEKLALPLHIPLDQAKIRLGILQEALMTLGR